MKKITKKNSIIYNQLWINKAIEEGHIEFLPVVKFPNKSIGEHIEIKYNQLYNEKFTKNYHNNTLDYYNHLISNSQKVTKKESLLFAREWILKYKEEGLKIPNRKITNNYSIGEVLELLYYQKEVITPAVENIFKLSGESYNRKKLR